MFSWKHDSPTGHQQRFAAALDVLLDRFPGVIDARHGPDLGLKQGNLDYVVTLDFDSADDYLVYRDHPDHQQLLRDYILDDCAIRSAIQFTL